MHVQPPRHGRLCLPGHHPANTAVTDCVTLAAVTSPDTGERFVLELNPATLPPALGEGCAGARRGSERLLLLMGVSGLLVSVFQASRAIPSLLPRGISLGQCLYMAIELASVKEEISFGFLERVKPSKAILQWEMVSHTSPGEGTWEQELGTGGGAPSAAMQGSRSPQPGGSSGGKGLLPAPELRVGPSYPSAISPCPHTNTTTNSHGHRPRP